MFESEKKLVIGFTGTQEGMTTVQWAGVKKILDGLSEIREAHHGDCIGADTQFHLIVSSYFPQIKIFIHPPFAHKKRSFCPGGTVLPKRQYLDRNHDIVDACSILIATPKEAEEVLRSGTWATIRYARKVGRECRVIHPKTGELM